MPAGKMLKVYTKPVKKRVTVKELSREVNKLKAAPEVKEHLVTNSLATVGVYGSANVFELTGITQGDGSNNREGSKIKLESIDGRAEMYVIPGNTSTLGYVWARMMLIRVVDNDGSTSSDLNEIIHSSAHPIGYRKAKAASNFSNYKVLFDRTYKF